MEIVIPKAIRLNDHYQRPLLEAVQLLCVYITESLFLSCPLFTSVIGSTVDVDIMLIPILKTYHCTLLATSSMPTVKNLSITESFQLIELNWIIKNKI